MSILRQAYFLLIPLVLAGCPLDSGVDAWEGVLNVDIDQDDDIAGEDVDETNGDGLPYPDGVDRVYDLTVVGTRLWLWAEDLDEGSGPVLISISQSSGAAEDPVTIDGRPGLLNAGSELTWDGEAFWFTSDENDPARAELFRVSSTGELLDTVPCPFSGTTGCRGLAWDGTFLWTADRTQVARVDPVDGSAVDSLTPWEDTTVSIDFLFAEQVNGNGRSLVVRDGRLYWVLTSTGAATEGPAVDFTRGGANSGTIWFPSDADRRILSRSVPPPP